jgi:hypothetical protein
MIAILFCALYFGLLVGIAYHFAYSDNERRARRAAPAAPARPPPPAEGPAVPLEENDDHLQNDDLF